MRIICLSVWFLAPLAACSEESGPTPPRTIGSPELTIQAPRVGRLVA